MSSGPRAYIIRRATSTDLAQLQEIERAAAQTFHAHGIAPEVVAAVTPLVHLLAAQEAGLLWVAADERDAPLGFALVAIVDGAPHLEEIDVAPERARQGIGRALIDEICRWARAAGHGSLTLSTFRDVPWNAPYYARLGFRPLEAGEMAPQLAERMAAEAARGLDPKRRVAMVRDTRSADE